MAQLRSHVSLLPPLGINANSLISRLSNAETRLSPTMAPSAPPRLLENSCVGLSSESLSGVTLTLAIGLEYFLPSMDHPGKKAAQVCVCLVQGVWCRCGG